MKKDKIEKSLIIINEKSIFYKIKKLFNKIFNKKKYESNIIEENKYNKKSFIEKKEFIEDIRNIETRLIKLQQKYRNGEIKENELTKAQIKSLCYLYDKQIRKLQKSNEFRKQRILQYKKIVEG